MSNKTPFAGRQNLMPPGWDRRRNAWLRRQPRCQAWTIEGLEKCLAPAVTVDHITPRFEGGQDGQSNYQSLCKACHDKKTAEEGRRAWAKKKARISRQFDFGDRHPSEY